MQDIYTLQPTNTIFNIKEQFPPLESGKKMGIFLSGGMESSLLVIMSQLIYGKDNVICLYSDAIFCENKEEKKTYIRTNIDRAIKNLNVSVEYIEFDYDLHVNNRRESILKNIETVRNRFNIDFVLFGFTKLFFEVEVFKQDKLSVDDVYSIAYSDPIKYKSTIEEFHLATKVYTDTLLDIDIPPEVYPLLRSNDFFIRSPFKTLNKSEVVDLYNQLNVLDKVYGTSSCIQSQLTLNNKHCGHCFNCQQRYDAFSILNNPDITDLTEYELDLNKQRREQLLNAINT